MQTKFGGMFSIILCVAAAFVLSVPAWAGGQVFVAGANSSGEAVYMDLVNDDVDMNLVNNDVDLFSSLEILQIPLDNGVPPEEAVGYGNGIGDFNNDTHYDYIVGLGYDTGHVYIAAGDGTQFAPLQSVASWSEGIFPMDIAVGDFNKDGKQDFVMSYMFTTNTGLYLNNGENGEFSFAYSVLPSSAPSFSAGIDAADFNGDGFDDFVVAPDSLDPIYVNINNQDGTFTQTTFDPYDGNGVYGIAAGDFNHDGIVDIATANEYYVIVYTGNKAEDTGKGDGTFQYWKTFEFDLDRSTIDDYDFNGDGYDDLVVGYSWEDENGLGQHGIAVLMNDSEGNFHLADTYPGSIGMLDAVSAPPYKPAPKNTEPVAVLDAASYAATVGEAITFDGSNSDDEDVDSLSYQWNFGDGDEVTEGGNAMETHVYSEAGEFTVTLTVIDNQGALASVEALVEVKAAPAVPVNVAFYPYQLSPHSRDKWITAAIRVPDAYDARQIDTTTVQIVTDDGAAITAYADRKFGFFHKFFRKHGNKHTLTVKFERNAVSKALAARSGHQLMKVVGKMSRDGKSMNFSGEGTIQVIGKHKKSAHHGYKHGWK